MKKILLFFIILLLPLLASAYICQDTNILANMPCDLITPYNYPQPCSGNVFKAFLAGVNVVNYTMAFYNLNYCYASLNLSIGDYFIITNLNDTATLKIVTNISTFQYNTTTEGINFNYIIIFIAIVWGIFLFLSFKTRIPLMLVLTALLTMAFGIVLYYVLPSTALLNVILGLVMVFLGIILMAYGFFSAKN